MPAYFDQNGRFSRFPPTAHHLPVATIATPSIQYFHMPRAYISRPAANNRQEASEVVSVQTCFQSLSQPLQRIIMFARNVKNGRDAGQNRFGRNARPVSFADFMRSGPGGKLPAMYERLKTAPAKSKLSTGRDRCETAKRSPKNDQYAHIRSPVGDYIRRPFVSSFRQQKVDESCGADIAQVREKTQNASTLDMDREDFDRMDFGKGISNLRLGYLCSRADVDSVFSAGIEEVQRSETTVEVFRSFANTFHDVLKHVRYEARTTDASTQTSTPKLQRSQMNFIYAGFWESCTHRQNRGMQTEEPNLTLKKQPSAMLLENSCCSKPKTIKMLFDWKSFGLIFFVSALLLGLMEILNHF